MRRVSWAMFFVLALMLAMAQRPAHAGIINGSVSLDTSGLSGTFELGFILTDGSATGDANNTVTLGNFGFGGGSRRSAAHHIRRERRLRQQRDADRQRVLQRLRVELHAGQFVVV